MTNKNPLTLHSLNCSYNDRRFRFAFYHCPDSPKSSFLTVKELLPVIKKGESTVSDWQPSSNRRSYHEYESGGLPSLERLIEVIEQLIEKYPSPRTLFS